MWSGPDLLSELARASASSLYNTVPFQFSPHYCSIHYPWQALSSPGPLAFSFHSGQAPKIREIDVSTTRSS